MNYWDLQMNRKLEEYADVIAQRSNTIIGLHITLFEARLKNPEYEEHYELIKAKIGLLKMELLLRGT